MRRLFLYTVLLTVSGVGLLLVHTSSADIAAQDIAAVWLFDGNGHDSEGQGINGNVVGGEWVAGLQDQALKLDGNKGGVKVPDSNHINTGGPFPKRTVMALFNCDDVTIADHKQTIFEEGGRTRGAVIYVFDSELWVGAWNRAEYNWNGAWISTPIHSGRWYYVAFVLRDTQGKVEDDKFEMWLDGQMIGKQPGGQLHAHGDDTGIGHVNQNTVFHDDDGSGSDIHFFGGLIDEIRVYNASLTKDEMDKFWGSLFSVHPKDKLTTVWGSIKR